MMLPNVFDWMREDEPKAFQIEDYWDKNINFPYSVLEDGIIVDSEGCPAIFTVDMLNSWNWEIVE